MTFQPSSPNRHPKRLGKPGRVDFDVVELDNLIDDQGINLKITPSILCPNRDKLGSTNHALDCDVCNGDEAVDLTKDCIETFGVIQSIRHEKTFEVQGIWDEKDATVTLKSPIRIYFWYKVEVLDHASIYNELIKRDDDDTDKLRYPTNRSCDIPFFLVDSDGKTYEKGPDYRIIQDQFIEWETANRPVVGTLFSIAYPVFPTFRVLETLHENRYYNVTSKQKVRVPVNLPQQAVIRWDYLANRQGNRQLIDDEPTP